MKKLALILLLLAIVAGVLGYSRLLGVAVYFAWILALVAAATWFYTVATGKKVV